MIKLSKESPQSELSKIFDRLPNKTIENINCDNWPYDIEIIFTDNSHILIAFEFDSINEQEGLILEFTEC